MGLSPARRLRRAAWGALALLAGAAGLDAALLWRAEALNTRIDSVVALAGAHAAADAPELTATAGTPAELGFAQAHTLAALGANEAALARYGALQGDSPLGQAARYNAANLLLRQGAVLHAGAQPGQALAHIELAKENYREVLRSDPWNWPARYNLERAQRLVPDPEDADESPPELNRNAERAATTMRGYSPGLP